MPTALPPSGSIGQGGVSVEASSGPRCSKPKPAGLPPRSTGLRPSGCRRCSTSAAAPPTFRERVQPWTERIGCFGRCAPAVSTSCMSTCATRTGDRHPRRPRPIPPICRGCARRGRGRCLCCNLLEHVSAPERLARHCVDAAAERSGSPSSRCRSAIPITATRSTRCTARARPSWRRCSPARPARRRRDRRRRHVVSRRRPPAAVDFAAARRPLSGRRSCRCEKWKRSMAKLYWLAAEYRITCAVFEKL